MLEDIKHSTLSLPYKLTSPLRNDCFMILSRYVFEIPFDAHTVLLYNSIDNTIIRVSKSKVESLNRRNEDSCIFTADEIRFLVCHHYIFSDEKEMAVFKQNRLDTILSTSDDTFPLVIETNSACNFECEFCYQKDLDMSPRRLSVDRHRDICRIIDDALRQCHFAWVDIGFIGGEPLLYTPLNTLIESINEVCARNNAHVRFKLNTNSFYLSREIVESMRFLNVTTSIGAECDYKRLIRLKSPAKKLPTHNLFAKLVNNIRQVSDLFVDTRFLTLCYNTNEQNVACFEEYVRLISSMEIKNCMIVPEYMHENHTSNFSNALSREDYNKWSQNDAIDILQEYGFPMPYNVKKSKFLGCQARSPYSFKIFADGSIGLCNGQNAYNDGERLHADMPLNDIWERMSDLKTRMASVDCLNCRKLFVCPDNTPCHTKCTSSNKDELELRDFIIKKFKSTRHES